MTRKEETIYFNRGVPAEESLPFEDIAEVFSDLPRNTRSDLLRYGNSGGYPPLKKILAGFYPESSEVQLFVANGSLQILDLIANHYLDSGDTVLVESPIYDRALKIFRRADLEVTGIGLKEDGIDCDELNRAFDEQDPKMLYTIPDFQNPTGTTTSKEKRKQIAELAENQSFEVIEDSPYRRLRYEGKDVPTIRSFNPGAVFQISSLSKLVCPGIRIGWLVGSREITDQLAEYAEDTYISPNQLSQGIIQWLLKDGWLEQRVEKLKALYRPRLRATLDSLERYFPESHWVEAEGGFFVGLWLPDPGKAEEFYRLVEKREVVFSSPNGFFPEKGGEGFVRLPFPALKTTELEEGIKRIAEVWHEI